MTGLLKSYAGVTAVMAALTLALFLISPLLGKRYRANSLYRVWIIVLLGFLVPLRLPVAPALTATAPAAISRPVAQAAAAQTSEALLAAQPAADTAAAETAPAAMNQNGASAAPFTWINLLTVVWLAGAAAALVWQGLKYLLFWQNIRRWKEPLDNPESLRIFQSEKARLGIRRQVELYRCQSIGSPMITGLLRPMLLLPDEDLTAEELPLVFRHELIHLKRHDLLVKIGLILAAALHWFNPAVYLLVKQLTFWQESACDEAVVGSATQEEKKFYSETIIRTIRRQMRRQTALSTSFYGGKNGMKRRIVAIMDGGGKHTGVVLLVIVAAAVSCLGMAFAMDAQPAAGGTVAYVENAAGGGSRLLSVPSANDWGIPIAAYVNGTQVTIRETRESSALPEWSSVDGEDNWAYVLVGGDGTMNGIGGWMPLTYLADTTAETLPTATLQTDSPTGYVNVYSRNDTQSDLLNAWRAGTEVKLLGRVQQWYQIAVDNTFGFVQLDNLALGADTQARLDATLPSMFDGITREEYQNMLTFDALYAQKSAQYDGRSVETWSLEDKAWYGQMEETYIGQHDHYFQLPQEGDLQKDEAVAIAWETFLAQNSAPADASQADYDFNLTFYSIPVMNTVKKRWDIRIAPKTESNAYFEVEIDSPSGEILDTSGGM